ncbi:MAG TPA: protein translocase subunit SecF [Euzebyales bacterium]|nr:protein translocase subunit SecF [Euzebyales bacterium]
MTATTAGRRQPGRVRRFLDGETHIDFIGRSRMWFTITAVLLVLCALAIAVRGINFGIDFTGGTSLIIDGATESFTAEDIRGALGELGIEESTVQLTSEGSGALISTTALDEVAGAQQRDVVERLMQVTGAGRDQIEVSAIGPRWGAQISQQALRGLGVFLLLVAAYISVRFEWRMAVAALLTLLHDVAITIGIYALLGFQVTPASVIALLTILGYSLYDTVVVFDRIAEDTERLGSSASRTYSEVANQSLNSVLVRSLSTSITSLLPVGALLFIGAQLLGATTLEDLALALFIGMAVGTYSSLAVATPTLAWLKEREPRYAELRHRLETRRGGARA